MIHLPTFEEFLNELTSKGRYLVVYRGSSQGLDRFQNLDKATAELKKMAMTGRYREIALYDDPSNKVSTSDVDKIILFYAEDGQYLDNVAKKDQRLAKKRFNK